MKRAEIITQRGAKFRIESCTEWSVEMVLWSLGIKMDDLKLVTDLDATPKKIPPIIAKPGGIEPGTRDAFPVAL